MCVCMCVCCGVCSARIWDTNLKYENLFTAEHWLITLYRRSVRWMVARVRYMLSYVFIYTRTHTILCNNKQGESAITYINFITYSYVRIGMGCVVLCVCLFVSACVKFACIHIICIFFVIILNLKRRVFKIKMTEKENHEIKKE